MSIGSTGETTENRQDLRWNSQLLQWRELRNLGLRSDFIYVHDDVSRSNEIKQGALRRFPGQAAANTALDFGHNLLLTANERQELDRKVEDELSKIPRVTHFIPKAQGLLFVETFEMADVFSSWIVSNNRNHPGRQGLLVSDKKAKNAHSLPLAAWERKTCWCLP